MHFVLRWDYHIRSVAHLLYLATWTDLPYINKESQMSELFTNLTLEVIQELDKETRKLILHDWKISAENRFKSILENLTIHTRGYEEFRFELRSDYEQIALEGYCEVCKGKQSIKLHYSELRKFSGRDGNNVRMDCPTCKTSNSLLVPDF